MLFSLIWWVVDARKWFKGPKVNIEHMMVGDTRVIEGQDGSGSDDMVGTGKGSEEEVKVLETGKRGLEGV